MRFGRILEQPATSTEADGVFNDNIPRTPERLVDRDLRPDSTSRLLAPMESEDDPRQDMTQASCLPIASLDGPKENDSGSDMVLSDDEPDIQPPQITNPILDKTRESTPVQARDSDSPTPETAVFGEDHLPLVPTYIQAPDAGIREDSQMVFSPAREPQGLSETPPQPNFVAQRSESPISPGNCTHVIGSPVIACLAPESSPSPFPDRPVESSPPFPPQEMKLELDDTIPGSYEREVRFMYRFLCEFALITALDFSPQITADSIS